MGRVASPSAALNVIEYSGGYGIYGQGVTSGVEGQGGMMGVHGVATWGSSYGVYGTAPEPYETGVYGKGGQYTVTVYENGQQVAQEMGYSSCF